MPELTLPRLLREVWFPLLISVTLQGLQALGNVGFPLLVKTLVDQVLPSRSVGLLLAVCAGFAVLAVIVVALQFAGGYASRVAAEDVTLTVRNTVSEHAHLNAGDDFTMQGTVGNQVALIAKDAQVLARLIGDALPQATFQGVRFIAAVVVIAALDWRLLLIAPVTLILFAIGPGLMAKRISLASRQAQDAEAEVVATATEALSGLFALRATAAIVWAQAQLAVRFGESRSKQLRLARLQLAGEVGYVALWLVYAGTYFFAGLQTFQGKISVGAVLALGQLMASLALPTHALGALFTGYTGALGSINRIREHLQVREPQIFSTARGTLPDDPLRGGAAPSVLPLVSDGISVVLADESVVLNDVSLTVDVAQQMAVVGASGAGKSTLAAVLAGLRAPTFGQVTAGGAPLAAWRESDFRRHVAIAFTEPYLFRGPIFDNVALGRADINEAFVAELLELIGGDDLPVWSALVEGGRNLSSGQRQRIGLARALAVLPEILILDEATSGLDTESETHIFRTVRDRWPRMSLLVISHRLATVLQCKQAVVLDEGRVVDRGDPRDLLTGSARMAELIRAQVIARA